MSKRYALSVDVGGTFTDLVLFDMDEGQTAAFHKVLTDNERPARAVITGWQEILDMVGATSDQVHYAVHSTTIVTNAIVARNGVKTGLITTRGFRDVLEIGIEQMYDIYDLFAPYPSPLVPRDLRREVNERVSRDGSVLEQLDEESVRREVEHLVSEGVKSIAVSLIHSYRFPDHERRVSEIIAEMYPDVLVSVSSKVAPIMGEYERTSTTAGDAYVKPLLGNYLRDLLAELRALGFERHLYLMLSSGGITTAETAMEFPIRLLESGPAAGAFAAGFFGNLAGHAKVLSFDMGGTTAKACLIENGRPGISGMLEADRVHRFKPGSGLPIMSPTVDLIEIGAGGGSIAHINELSLMAVGPQSAEADPGPASYGLGGELPTVTDANTTLGYLDPDYFLGGRMTLLKDRAESAIREKIAGKLGISTVEAAHGIYKTVNENMAQAARTHLIERNQDPRDIAMVAFGGAGPVHAVEVARILGIRKVIAPYGAGVASAIGALTAPMAIPLVRAYMTSLDKTDWAHVARLYDEMRSEALDAFAGALDPEDLVFSSAFDMRYEGQYHELRVEFPGAVPAPELVPRIIESFSTRYEEVYGRVLDGVAIEILNWHLEAESRQVVFSLTEEDRHDDAGDEAKKHSQEIRFAGSAGDYVEAVVYDRYKLRPGARISGPCIVQEKESTIVVPPDGAVFVDGYRNLIISLTPESVA